MKIEKQQSLIYALRTLILNNGTPAEVKTTLGSMGLNTHPVMIEAIARGAFGITLTDITMVVNGLRESKGWKGDIPIPE